MTEIEFSHKLINLHDNLSYFAKLLTKNSTEADDLIQDTYIKALTNRNKFTTDTNLKAWTFTIMKNTFINNFRREKKNNLLIDNALDYSSDFITSKRNNVSPDSLIFEKDILLEINKIDEEQRLPFEMYNAGYKYKEIADKLKLSIGTVKSRIFFTRQKLMESLKDYVN